MIDYDHDCPICDATGRVEGTRPNRFGGGDDDVEFVCSACNGKGGLTEDEWHLVCRERGLCPGCGLEEPPWRAGDDDAVCETCYRDDQDRAYERSLET